VEKALQDAVKRSEARPAAEPKANFADPIGRGR